MPATDEQRRAMIVHTTPRAGRGWPAGDGAAAAWPTVAALLRAGGQVLRPPAGAGRGLILAEGGDAAMEMMSLARTLGGNHLFYLLLARDHS